MEWIDVVDEKGTPTGEVVDRETAHAQGILHRTAHVWIVRKRGGRVEILLQKRSGNKDSYPGCYDISSAGHIPAGVDFIPSAIRELWEELGIRVSAAQLIYCGQRKLSFDQEFHGRPFHDRQVSNIYALWLDREEGEFVLQEEEVFEVRWFGFDDCVDKVSRNLIPHCIYREELEMVERALHLQEMG